MPGFNLLFTVTGSANGVVEAATEEEARAKVDRGEWTRSHRWTWNTC
jgi:hypothetical protein